MSNSISVEMALACRMPRYVEKASEADDGMVALMIDNASLILKPALAVILAELAPMEIRPKAGILGDWALWHGGGKTSCLPLEALTMPGKARDDLLFILIGRAVRRFKGACALADFHSRLADLFTVADAA
ncbi:hypothetical protein [Rhizobium alvei]|uniref:Uncharacterized protein n=1 Tax=Rhizobium alvei TaxID=1132659 RepID=A0ABT8YQ93_9HYPH|nr:hypothetical protein [Rhizobium alvei]MDO6965789.1 hypothetical protein [Rhizobium alvei]